jgi:hypothetical protein
MEMKIGVGITTFNKQDYYDILYDSLPLNEIDCLITTNMGSQYSKKYNGYWNQWKDNYDSGPAEGRNQNIKYLLDNDCDYIFLIEDDMIIKNKNVFKEYINKSIETGIKYFIYCSSSSGSGSIGNRTPKFNIKYPGDCNISFYPNMNNDFVCHHKSNFEERLYDTTYRYIFDIEFTYYHMMIKKNTSPFWSFPDIHNSDLYINNQPGSESRINEQREKKLFKEFTKLKNQIGFWVTDIPRSEIFETKKRLKSLYENRKF